MPLTPEELTRAIAQYQGAAQPVTQLPVDPTVAMVPPQEAAPVVVPPVQEAVQPPPVVDAALPPSAPDTYVVPQAHNSREAMGQMDQASAAQANAITDETNAKRDLEAQQATLLDTQSAEQQAQAAKFQAEQKAGQERAQKIYDDSQKIESEANSIQTRDRRTTSQRVLGIIGTALGGLADGLSGFSGKQTNFAQQIEKGINDAVHKDMAQQQAAIDGKHKQAAMKLTEFGIAHKLFVDDPKAAFEYASTLRKDMFAKQAEALTKRSSNPVAAAQGAQAAQKILQENAEKKASLLASKENAYLAAQAASTRVATTNPESPYENMTQQQLQDIKDSGRLPAAGQNVLNKLITGDNTQGAAARNPEVIAQTQGAKLSEDLVVRDPKIAVQYAADAPKLQTGIDAARQMTDLIDQIVEDRKLFTIEERAKDKLGLSEIGSRLESNSAALDLVSKEVNKLGALSGPDIGLVRAVVGNAKSWTPGADTQLGKVKANTIKNTNDIAFKRGLEHPFQTAASTKPEGKDKPQIVAGGKAVDASKMIAPDTAPATVMMSLDGVKFFPVAADKVADAKKKFPKAVVKE